LFNFFARDLAPPSTVSCQVAVPGAAALRLELPLDDDLSRNWYFWGYSGYEWGLTRLFRHLLQFKRRVFDVGAHVGYYTLMAASLLKENGSVHAFEPSPDVYPHLLRNSQLNGFGHVRLNQVALSDIDGEGLLYIPASGEKTNASLLPDYVPSRRQVRVPLMRFDTYCATHAIPQVDLIKLDVEGAELQVLLGMGDRLHAWQPDIVIEVLRPFQERLDAFFHGTPYRKFVVTNNGLRELSRIEADPWFRDMYLSCAPALPAPA
jgi:FkbM family methyltransferase